MKKNIYIVLFVASIEKLEKLKYTLYKKYLKEKSQLRYKKFLV